MECDSLSVTSIVVVKSWYENNRPENNGVLISDMRTMDRFDFRYENNSPDCFQILHQTIALWTWDPTAITGGRVTDGCGRGRALARRGRARTRAGAGGRGRARRGCGRGAGGHPPLPPQVQGARCYSTSSLDDQTGEPQHSHAWADLIP